MPYGLFITLNLFTIFLNLVVGAINLVNFIRYGKPIFIIILIFNAALLALVVANLLGAFGRA